MCIEYLVQLIGISISFICRLVKGDGEIIEEIVSRDRQRAINKVRRYKFYPKF